MVHDPIITTIITTYQRPHLLKKAIQSVQNQTVKNILMLVCDSASCDETEEVVRELAKADSRIVYHKHPTQIRAAENYQFGIDQVQTPYFSILSDDDHLLPNFYGTALAALEKHPSARFFLGSIIDSSDDGKPISANALSWPLQELFYPPQGLLPIIRHYFNWSGSLFETRTAKQHPLNQTVVPIDYDFVLRLGAQYPFVFSLQPCGYFIHHATSYSNHCGIKLIYPSFSIIQKNLLSLRPESEQKQIKQAFSQSFNRKLLQISAGAIKFDNLTEMKEIGKAAKIECSNLFLTLALSLCLALSLRSKLFRLLVSNTLHLHRSIKQLRIQAYLKLFKQPAMTKLICMALHSYHVGGSELQLFSLSKALRKQGIDLLILHSHTRGSLPCISNEYLTFHSIPQFIWKFRLMPLYLHLFFRSKRPSLFHCHGLSRFTEQIIAFAKQTQTPSILKLLTDGDIDTLKKETQERLSFPRWLKTLATNWSLATQRSAIKNTFLGKHRDHLYRALDGFIAINPSMEKELQRFSIPPSKIFPLPNGVDPDRFKPLEEKLPIQQSLHLPPAHYIAMVARFEDRKRHTDLIHAWAKLEASYPHHRLLLIGDGAEKKPCEQLAQKLSIQDRIHFTSTQLNIEHFLQASDLFVFTSEREGLPNAILEAMSCALPIVASSISGVIDLIQHGENGLLFPAKDIAALIHSIKTALDRPDYAKQLGKAARQTILDRYSFDCVAPKFIELYKTLQRKRKEEN